MEDNRITIDVPAEEGQKGLMGVFYALYLKLGSILQSPEFSKEPIRLHYMTTLLVSMVPDLEEREVIKTKMQDRRKELTEQYKKEKKSDILTPAEKDHLLIEASLESVGYIQSYVDRMMGLVSENKVGFCIPIEENIRKEIKNVQ